MSAPNSAFSANLLIPRFAVDELMGPDGKPVTEDARITALWCLKEATTKALGLGFNLAVSEVIISEIGPDGVAVLAVYGKAADRLVSLTLVNFTHSLIALAALPFVGLPAPESWPYLLASLVIHQAYYAGLVMQYRFGDLGQVYPLARGASPLSWRRWRGLGRARRWRPAHCWQFC